MSPPIDLNQKQMELIRAYVQDLGGGFMMLGSENSFGLGGYYKTPIEEILPVRTDTEKEERNAEHCDGARNRQIGKYGGDKN